MKTMTHTPEQIIKVLEQAEKDEQPITSYLPRVCGHARVRSAALPS